LPLLRSMAATSAALTGVPSAWWASSTPSSSKVSRTAVMAWISCTRLWVRRRVEIARACASASSMVPPGKT